MALPADYRRVTYACIHFMELDAADRLKSSLTEVLVAEIDGRRVRTDDDLFTELTAALKLPDYFGRNWNALEECLRDLSWLPAPGYVLFVSNARDWWEAAGLLAGSLVESWLFAAEDWSREGVSFHLVFVW